MITVFMNPNPQDQTVQTPPVQPVHPLMPVDATGKPVNVTTFRPGGKESAPMTLPPDAFTSMKATETTPVIHEEVEVAGVSATPQVSTPIVPADQQAIGVKPAKTAIPVTIPPVPQVVDEPAYAHMTIKEAEVAAKKQGVHAAIRWALTKFIKEEKEVEYRDAHAEKLAA